MTRPYAEVIGDPIAQSKSPLIHNFWLAKLGIAADYRAAHVTPEGLGSYFAARRLDPAWRGCNVTMPHKQAVMGLIDRIDAVVARVGAVNTVVRSGDGTIVGYNTDVAGFLEPFGQIRFQTVSVIGAGGAARAVLAGLADRGIASVTLQNRSLDKAEALIGEFGLRGPVVSPGEAIAPVELLVNTSSLGMVGHPAMPAVERYVIEGGTVYDIVTHPLDTQLLQNARAQGLRTIDGLAMLIGQAAAAFEMFFGEPAPRQHDAELRALLTA